MDNPVLGPNSINNIMDINTGTFNPLDYVFDNKSKDERIFEALGIDKEVAVAKIILQDLAESEDEACIEDLLISLNESNVYNFTEKLIDTIAKIYENA